MQHTISNGGQPATLDPGSRRQRPEPIPEPVLDSSAALEFSIAGVLTAALAITAAALLYHGSGSSVIIGSAFGCLTGAVLLQVGVRRRVRHELVDDARRNGAEDPEAASRACLARWLER
ncbi:MAG TPA: hypothetical protein VK034_29415 [Enhygromyxa sp.]|nr:hypothetical protein [Enhygromyxa sp.]